MRIARFATLQSIGVLLVASIVPAAPSDRPLTLGADRQAHDHWTPPRTADGQPDLQGVWANNTPTPFERPKQLADKEFLTDQELDVLKQRAARLFDGGGDLAVGDELFLALLENPDVFKSPRAVGDSNQYWVFDGLDFENRTSQIVDPRDGHMPPLTPEGREKVAAAVAARRQHPADGPEDRTSGERCIAWGTARVGFLQSRNNSYYQIVQTPGYVVINHEMIHEARIIPLAGSPHLPPHIRSWSGDSRGHWEGSTLVIDTTNFYTQARPAPGVVGTGERVHLVERLTRVDADTMRYQVTVEDPTIWTTPWTAMTTWKRSANRMFEYACHEANYGLGGILRGARADEQAAADAKPGVKQDKK